MRRPYLRFDPKSLGDAMVEMDLQIRRKHRVNLTVVNRAIKLAQEKGHLTSSQVAHLLRTTGVVLRQLPPASRGALTKLVWNLAELQTLDISHYNALLQAYLENETPFNPQMFLGNMRNAGIVPNRVTYQRFIQRYCEMGNIAGATELLEILRNEQRPLSEQVFNAFVKGHLRNDNDRAVTQLMQAMRDAGVGPTSETYTVLACGLIENGRRDEALQAIKGRSLSDAQVLRVAIAFALKDDLDSVRATVDTMPMRIFYVRDAVNACFDMTSLGKADAARIVFSKLQSTSRKPGSGKFLIAQMVRSNLPVIQVKQLCQDLKDAGVNDAGLMHAVQTALRFADRQVALDYVRLLPETGYALRKHFFFPILCKTTNEAEVYDTLRAMTSMRAEMSIDTLVHFVLPRLICSEPEKVVERLLEAGCKFELCLDSLASHLLLHGEVKKCWRMLEAYRYEPSARLAYLVGRAVTSENVELCVRLLKKLVDYWSEHGERPRCADPVGDFLDAVPDKILGLVVAAVELEEMPISSELHDEVCRRFGSVKTSLTGAEENKKFAASTEGRKAAVQQLEDQLAKLERSKMDARDVTHELLRAYCEVRAIEQADQLLRRLDGKKLPPSVLTSCIDLNVYKGDLEAALDFYQEGLELDNFFIEDRRLVKLAALAVRNHRIAEAKEILDRHEFDEVTGGNQITALRLVNATADRYSPEEVLHMVDNYVQKFAFISRPVLTNVMNAVLNTGDIDASMRAFKNIAERYKVITMKESLSRMLISADRQAELDEVTAIATNIEGSANADIDLVSYYVGCGQIEKARRHAYPGLASRTQSKVEAICEMFIDRGLIESLEAFLKLLEEFSYDKRRLYHLLVRGYCNADKVDKALDVWTKAQEHNVVLFGRTLRYLARFLRRKGREVPFVTPAEPASTSEDAGDVLQQFQHALDSCAIDDAVELYRRAMLAGQPPSTMVRCNFIVALVEDGQLDVALETLKDALRKAKQDPSSRVPHRRAVRLLLRHMASRGMVDEIESLRPMVDFELKKFYSYTNSLCLAYLNAGRVTEYLDILDGLPITADLGYFWVNIALESDPSHFGRILQNAKRFALDGENYTLLKVLWEWLFRRGEYARAQEVLVEFPEMLHRKHGLSSVIRRIRETADEVMSKQLLTALKSAHVDQPYAIALSAHLDILLAKGRVDEAFDCLRMAHAEGFDLGRCSNGTLQNLRNEQLRRGEPAEFELPFPKNVVDAQC
ncbi:hypothetical protein BIW11_00514 [Tropilaelaps mercedesae]|uniref:Leucine-rich PPR motif-containing protein n=1 Tax=Tropilaelaps mercedesae TaxID=418985 RepID=A0A1V9XUA5_9ACAR|nr:hypothetical protein BIW11_00514 [Tropilaelaps mercedesae]